MKKELIAGILLVLILAGCIINSRAITNLSDNLIGLVEEAGADAMSGRWEDAERGVDEAFRVIEHHNLYIGIALPMDDTDRITDSLDQLRGQIHSQNAAGIRSAVHLAVSRLDSIAHRERANLGSIF